jgi:hypothetical protein
MVSKELRELKESISEKLTKHNQKVLFVIDFDGTLIDTFNSVLAPVLSNLNVNIGTYEEFSNRNGSFKKYVGLLGHRIHNLKKYYKLDKHEFQKTLMDSYLLNAKKVIETSTLVRELSTIKNIEYGVVSRNYISNYFHPENLIENILKKLEIFENNISFVKRISPREHKTKCFEYIRKDYSNHIIISLGDEIGDYVSAISAKFDSVFAIEGFDSKELFQKHNISTSLKDKLDFTILYAIEKKLYEKFDLYEQSHLVEH